MISFDAEAAPQATQPTQTTTDRPTEKLRSTCDACSASKVRCNKQKPSCRRCISLKLDCVYGRSRRKGKPSSSETKLAAQLQRSLDPQPKECSTSPIVVGGGLPRSYSWCGPDFSDAFNGFPPGPEDVLPDDFFNGTLWNSYSTPSALESPDTPKSKLFSSSSEDSSILNVDTHNLALSTSPEKMPMICDNTLPDLTDIAAPFSHNSHGHPCISMAFTTLTDLYQLALRHPPSTSVHIDAANPSSDQILKTNRVAVQSLDSLLKCDCETCSQDSHMPFLLATIGSKVLGWYRAIYNGDIVQPSSTTRHTQSERPTSSTAITIGDFKLDKIAETRMKAQLLLCELQNVGKVFDVLAQRNRGRANDPRTTERGVYEAFEQFLRSSLNDLVAKLDSFCVFRG